MRRHGSAIDPPNRFLAVHCQPDLEDLEWDDAYRDDLENRPIEYLADDSKSIVSTNDSPDIPFRYSVNPYRGCAHGCAYCYARNSHEYLGMSAGLDFETKILVKKEAPALLRALLDRKGWRPEPITFSGVTDCYQPAERHFRLTRQCLEVAWDYRQPVTIVTKNALVVRDLDLLTRMAGENLVHVFLSVTTRDAALARNLEPRTSIPEARLRAVRMLAEAGVPVGVMTAPIIPGLNDSEIPSLLGAAREAGAQAASYTLLRLPLSVEPVFLDWLARNEPLRKEKIEARIRAARSGKLNSTRWGERMRGTGQSAEQIRNLFRVFARKYELDGRLRPLDCSRFRRPSSGPEQRMLF